MELYIICIENKASVSVISTDKVNIINQIELGAKRVYELATGIMVDKGIVTNLVIPCILSRWIELGEAKVYYNDNIDVYNIELGRCSLK